VLGATATVLAARLDGVHHALNPSTAAREPFSLPAHALGMAALTCGGPGSTRARLFISDMHAFAERRDLDGRHLPEIQVAVFGLLSDVVARFHGIGIGF
jgi:hypothetical protein